MRVNFDLLSNLNARIVSYEEYIAASYKHFKIVKYSLNYKVNLNRYITVVQRV